jgi:predicted kinase
MTGFAGAGKTDLARKLHRELGWKMLSKDDLKREHLAGGEAKEQAGWKAFEDLFQLAEKTLMSGESAIIDTSNEKPFIFERIQEMLQNLASLHIHPCLLILFCLADKSTRSERLKKRGSVLAPYENELPAVLDDSELLPRFEHLFLHDFKALAQLRSLSDNPSELDHFIYFPGDEALIINTTPPLETYAEKIRKEIIDFKTARGQDKAEI